MLFIPVSSSGMLNSSVRAAGLPERRVHAHDLDHQAETHVLHRCAEVHTSTDLPQSVAYTRCTCSIAPPTVAPVHRRFRLPAPVCAPAGNYDTFCKTVKEDEVIQQKKYQKEQEDIKHLKEFIASAGTYANLVKQIRILPSICKAASTVVIIRVSCC